MNGILSNLRDPIDRVSGQRKDSAAQGGDPFTLEEQNWTTTNGSNLIAGQWVDAAIYEVEAQTRYNIGYGTSDNEATVGRFYAHLEDGASNVVSGQVRLVTRDANNENVDTEIAALTTSRLDADASDYRTQVAVPEVVTTPKVGEDSKIVLQFNLDSGSTGTSIDFSAAGTEHQLDLTRYA